MFTLVTVLTLMSLAACVVRYKKTYNFITYKREKSFRNFVIANSEIGDYFITHYMCKGKMFAYIHPSCTEHTYFETPVLSESERRDKTIVFATFVTKSNTNFQIVTKKVRRFAGLDSGFYMWKNAPLFVKRKVLKAPKDSTGVRLIYANGEHGFLPLTEEQ